MTTDLVELGDFSNPILAVPLNAKVYKIASVSAKDGLTLQKIRIIGLKSAANTEITARDLELVSDDEEPDFFRMVLGDTYDEILTDGLSYQALKYLASLAFVWTTGSFADAQTMWNNSGKAQKKPAAPQDRLPKTATRTSSAAGTTTRKRASRTTTSTRKATGAAATSGKTSSATGTPSKPTSKTSE